MIIDLSQFADLIGWLLKGLAPAAFLWAICSKVIKVFIDTFSGRGLDL